MGIKNRFKRALFSFFKEDILKEVGYDYGYKQVEFVCNEMKMVEIKSEILLADNSMSLAPPHLLYEKELENCKRRLFEESMKYIKIDERSVMDSHIYDARAIRVSLFIGESHLKL